MLTYRLEGAVATNPGDALFVINNSFVNDKGSGIFINVAGDVGTPAIVQNNVFVGAGTIVNQASAVQTTNFSGGDPMFVDQAGYDYHLKDGSPCQDTGSDPGMGGGMSLVPAQQYVHPTSYEGRMTVATIDIGAYELGGGTGGGPGGAGGAGAGGSGSGASGTGASGAANASASAGAGLPGSTDGTGEGSSGGDASGDDGGCGCRVGDDADEGGAWPLAALLAAAFAFRRRTVRSAAARATPPARRG
jgi:MYXO-CTERM domain-containing protein